jgi:glycosyltransferase involved in cell wall biosynthesis
VTAEPKGRSRTVAHVLPWAGIGGTEHATLRIAAAVRERGFHSVAFCRDDAADVHGFFRDAGIETVPYRMTELSLRRPMPFIRHTLALSKELTRREIDLVHCADVDAGMQAGFAGRLARVPVLCHVRNPVPQLTRGERLQLAPVNAFVFVSKDTWSTFAYNVDVRRGRVLYDGLPPENSRDAGAKADVRRELGLRDETRVVGMTARMSPQKDFITLGRAAVRVREVIPDTRFVVVGDIGAQAAHREHFAAVREQLAALGVLDAFLFTGFRSDVARVMRAFDVFVLSTHFEGLPLVVLEAMAMGLPVIATAVNGIPEVIDSDDVGLLVAHENHDELAAKLIGLLTDATRANRVGDAGREAVRQRFSARTFEENLVALYTEVLGSR